MAIIGRTIDHYLLEIVNLAASGHVTAASEVVDDLGDTLVAIIVAANYPADAVVDGKKVGGQFMPKKDGSSGGSSGSGAGGAGAGESGPARPDITALAESVKNLDTALSSVGPGPIDKAKSAVAGALSAAGSGVAAIGAHVEDISGDSFEKMAAALEALEVKTADTAEAIKAGAEKAKTEVGELKVKAKKISDVFRDELPPTPDSAPDTGPPELLESLGKKMDDWLLAKAGQVEEKGKDAIKAAQAFEAAAVARGKGVMDSIGDKRDAISAQVDGVVKSAEAKVSDVAAWGNSVKDAAAGMKSQAETMVADNAAMLGDAYRQDVGAVLKAADDTMAAAQGVIDKGKNDIAAAGQMAQQLKTDIKNLPQTTKTAIDGAVSSAKAKVDGAVADAKTITKDAKDTIAAEYEKAALQGEVRQLFDAVAKDVKGTAKDTADLVSAAAKLANLTAQATMSSYWAALKNVPLEQSPTQKAIMAKIEKLRENPALSKAIDQSASNVKKAYEYMAEGKYGGPKITYEADGTITMS